MILFGVLSKKLLKKSENHMKKMLKIATYNIKHGGSLGKNCQDIARLIHDENIDVVGFQEVDSFISRSGNQDIIKTIATLAGYPYYTFHKALDYSDGEYGLGIMSKYPYHVITTIPLVQSIEPRILVEANLQVNDQEIPFFVTHLELGSYEEVRRHQFKQIKDHLSRHQKFILTGDFNVSDWNNENGIFEYQEFFGEYRLANHRYMSFYTYHSDYHLEEVAPLDNIITSQNVEMMGVYMIHNHYSDHNLFVATIKF